MASMNAGEQLADVLNDLIKVNNDRVEGYKTALSSLKATDIDLQTMFTNMAEHSKQHLQALRHEVDQLGEIPTEGTSQPGKIYRLWMDLRAKVTAHDRRSIISLCEFGEDAALRSYDAALEHEPMPERVREMIAEQRSDIASSHDVVKRYRDMQDAVKS